MDISEDNLEMTNFAMKALILATTIFFLLAFIVLFFGFFGVTPLSSQETLFTLSPVIVLLLIFSLIYNLTRHRCPECRTFIKRGKPCPVCQSIRSGAVIKPIAPVIDADSFLEEDGAIVKEDNVAVEKSEQADEPERIDETPEEH